MALTKVHEEGELDDSDQNEVLPTRETKDNKDQELETLTSGLKAFLGKPTTKESDDLIHTRNMDLSFKKSSLP